MHTRTSQCSVVSGVEIDRAYSDLLHSVEEFLVELRSRQEQQRIKDEEEEKLRKIREEEVGTVCIYDQCNPIANLFSSPGLERCAL